MPSTGSELELRAFKVHAPAAAALREVLATLQIGQSDFIYAIRSRIKPVNDVIEKVTRKRTNGGKPNYEPEDITDVVGIRIVTLFREDIIEATKLVLAMIKHEQPYDKSPLKKGNLTEAIVYTTAPVADPEAIVSRLRSAFQTAGFQLSEDQIQQVKTGYSSVHIVAYCVARHDGESYEVPLEIQVRTLFEDAWSEIDHKLRYSGNRSKAPTREAFLESWQPHLNVLKTFADGCAQYAGIIKNHAIDAKSKSSEGVRPLIPVETAEDALKQIGTVSAELAQTFVAAYHMRKIAIDLRTEGAPNAEIEQKFVAAADAFQAAFDQLQMEDLNVESKEAAVFFSKMERAFCLLSIDNKPSLDQALQIYAEMQHRTPDSVIVHYRYAQALARLNEHDNSITRYVRAEELLATDKHIPDTHWLRYSIPRNLGFVRWTKADLLAGRPGSRDERVALLLQAYGDTKRAYAYARSKDSEAWRLRCANNALYYGIEYHGLLPANSLSNIDVEEMREFLSELESHVDLGSADRSRLNWLDTLCRAFAFFKEWPKAVLAAERIEHLLSATSPDDSDMRTVGSSYYGVTGALNPLERDVLDHALWVLRNHGPGPEHSGN